MTAHAGIGSGPRKEVLAQEAVCYPVITVAVITFIPGEWRSGGPKKEDRRGYLARAKAGNLLRHHLASGQPGEA